MTSKITIKKSSVASKVPLVADLDYGELALNYADGKLYYKKSDNTIQQLNASGTGDMSKSTYDTNNNGKVDSAEAADSVPWSGITGTPSTFTPSAHTHPISDITNLQSTLDGKVNTFAVQNANSVFAGPITGSQALPAFRALVAEDIPTLNQNTTGSAASLTTAHTIYGNSFNGTQDLTQIISSQYGGTGNGFAKFSGPATTEKTYTLPNSNATILTTADTVTIAQGGTGQTTKSNAFDALTPSTTKGDLVAFNGSTSIRLPVGSDNLYLAADSSTASGLAWKSTLTDPVVYTAYSLSLTDGVYVSGSVTDIQTYNDGNFYQITDGTLSPGPAWAITVTFNNVASFNRVVTNVDYTQNSGHTIYFQVYNNSTLVWDNLGSYSGSTGYTQYALAVLNDTAYISNGTVLIRLYHSSQGNATHTTKLDYLALEQTTTGSQGPRGATGATGTTGQGVPTAGTTGQYLRKSSATNYDTAWSAIAISEVTDLQTTLDGKDPSGTAAAAITTHEAAVDPHPQYTTLPEIAAVTKDIHGFIDRTSTTLSFNEGTRTFTISPTSSTWSVYILGSLKTITGSLSLQIPNATSGYFIRVNSAGTALEYVAGTPDFANDVYCVYIYWNSTTGKALIVGDERHGSQRDTTWHSNQHLNVGTVWRSGGAVSYTLNNDSSVNLGFATPIKIADEDLLHTIVHSASPAADYEQVLDTSAELEVLYLDGSAYTTTTASTSPWIAGTSTARYNQITAGSGSLVDAGEGKYITYWVLATNDIRRPVKLVLGRQAHSTIDAAYSETFTDYGISFAEQVFMHQVVVQTSTSYSNTAKVVIAAVRKIQEKLASSASTYGAGAHSELTGRESADQHPISAITNLQTTLNSKQDTLVSGTNIKTVNSTSLVGSGNVAVQEVLVSGTNIKTVNSTSLLGSGDVAITSVANISGGTANQLLYQTGAGATSFITAPVTANTYLKYDGASISWSTVTASASLAVGSSTVTGGTNGYILYNNSGTLGNLATSGSGSVVLNSAPAISGGSINNTTVGATTPTTGAFTTITSTSSPASNTAGVLTLSGTPNSGTNGRVGLLQIGPTLGAADKNIIAVFGQSINDYTQIILQNTSSGITASADIVINNDNTTGQGTYIDMGINSSGFTGTGSFNLPNAGYLTTVGGDLVLGTSSANAIRFVINDSATDAASISTGGVLSLGSPLGIASGGTGVNSAPAADAALRGFTTTATAGGTTILTNTSSVYQLFTGSTTQIVQLPNTNTLVPGWSFHIVNNSTGNLTINTSTGVTLGTVPPGVTVMPTSLVSSGNTAADWEFGYTDFSTLTGTGANVLGTSPTISYLTLAAGTATAGQAPIKLTSGTNLGTVEAGAIEYNGVKAFLTTGDTTSSRSVIDNSYYFYTTATGGALTGTSDLFTAAAFTMAAGATYIIEAHVYFLKTTAGTVAFSLVATQTPQSALIGFNGHSSALTAGSGTAAGANTTTTTPVSASLANGGNFYIPVRAVITANATTPGTVKLQVLPSAGSVTIQRGSHLIIRRLPATNVGAFA